MRRFKFAALLSLILLAAAAAFCGGADAAPRSMSITGVPGYERAWLQYFADGEWNFMWDGYRNPGSIELAPLPTEEELTPFIQSDYTGHLSVEVSYAAKLNPVWGAYDNMQAGRYVIAVASLPSKEWDEALQSSDTAVLIGGDGSSVSMDIDLFIPGGVCYLSSNSAMTYPVRVYVMKLTHTPLPKYTLTAEAGANGTVAPAEAEIEEGYSQDFEVKADEGYLIKSLTLDGAAVQEAEGLGAYVLKLENVTEAHKIAAEFELAPLPTFAITASAGENGTITPSGEVTAEQGAAQKFEIKANEGYVIETLTVDGKEDEEASGKESFSFTFENVTETHTIAATFKRAYSGGGGGGGCDAGLGSLSLLALAPFVLRRKK